MSLIDTTIIIADDLTGANDTALQYFKNTGSSRIIIEPEQEYDSQENVQVWAISTESRNIDKQTAVERVVGICEKLKNKLGTNFYKKIDSTLRGNVGAEILALLEETEKDAAIIVPAYIEENRSTIGGYQLLNGIPIERTQCALDPRAPIFESYIPDILKHGLNDNAQNLIDKIELNIVSKGAGPIITKIKELIENGKKIIVIDAMSNTDLEQIALSIKKCGYNILPCGSAGLAESISKILNHNNTVKNIESTPNLPKLIVSGSATQLSAKQIEKLKEEKNNIFCVDLTAQDIISGINEKTIKEISQNLLKGIDVIIHSSNINKEIASDETENILIDAGIAKDEFSSKITDYLSDLVYEINLASDFILITIGGETSFKCAKKINSKYLEILDAIMPSIPLCIDSHGKIIVTKSGNFGTSSTLVDIMNYFNKKK